MGLPLWRPNLSYLLPLLCTATAAAALSWTLLAGALLTTSFWLGVALALMLSFGLIWAYGIRYPDVGWMVVIAGLLAIDTLSNMAAAEASWTKWDLVLTGTTKLGLMMAFGAFILSFFRAEVRTGILEGSVFATLTTVFAVGLILPRELLLAAHCNGTAETYVGAVVLAGACVYGSMALTPMPPKRKRFATLVLLTTAAAVLALMVHSRHDVATSLNQTPLINYALAVALATFLLADLVIFHRDYLKTKSQRTAPKAAAIGLEVRAELMAAFALSCGPVGTAQGFGEFSLYSARDGEGGGSWSYTWDTEREKRLVFGEIFAPGPDGALGHMAVVLLLRTAEQRGYSLRQTLNFLNTRLLDIFERHVTATAMAISLGTDGSVELFNAGGAGFFTVTREGAQHYPLNSTPLGVSPNMEIANAPVPLDDGDIIFAGTSGMIDGTVGTRRILDFFDAEVDISRTAVAIQAQVIGMRQKSTPPIDQLLWLIQRLFAGEVTSAQTVLKDA